MAAHLQPDARAAIEWQCAEFCAGKNIPDQRDGFLSAICGCSADLEGWSTQLSQHCPEWAAKAEAAPPANLAGKKSQAPNQSQVGKGN